jgi:hypothetical protein
MILDSCNEDTPQVKQLISIVNGEMSKEEFAQVGMISKVTSFAELLTV